jgi:hypothetical protein
MKDIDRIVELQRLLAYEGARSTLASESLQERERGEVWHSLKAAELSGNDEYEYLHAIGRLKFHPKNTAARIWFQFLPLEGAE